MTGERAQEMDFHEQWSEVAKYTVEDGHLVERQDMTVIDMQREQLKEVECERGSLNLDTQRKQQSDARNRHALMF